MYKLCSLAVAGLVAGWLTLATPAVTQAQQFSFAVGSGPGVYGGGYYRPGYGYHHHHRGWWGGYYGGGYYAPRPVIVQPAPVVVAPGPAYVTPAPAVVVPQRAYYAPY